MARPTEAQQIRARSRIRAIVELKPEGKGRQAQKLQVARLLGYKGGRKNMIRSVDRVIMRDRKSNQARRLRSTKQIEAVDRSFNYYVKKTGVIVIDKNLRLDIKGAVLARANLADFRTNANSVFRQEVVLPRAIFSHKRGLIAGDVVSESRPGVFSPRYVVSEVPRYGLGFANTFGFKDPQGRYAKTDVIYIFNKRIEILLEQEDTESLALTIIFREEGIPPDVWADMTIEQRRDLRLNLFARDAFPDNTNMTTVVVD